MIFDHQSSYFLRNVCVIRLLESSVIENCSLEKLGSQLTSDVCHRMDFIIPNIIVVIYYDIILLYRPMLIQHDTNTTDEYCRLHIVRFRPSIGQNHD